MNDTSTYVALSDSDLTEEIGYQKRQIPHCTTPEGIERRTGQLARAEAEQNRRRRA